MSNHTGTVCACQDHAHSPRPESTLPPSPDTIDRRLVQRYGAWLLTGGYTALPTYAWLYYARLGVTEAEMVLIAQLCTYWWTERAPHPGEAALAARMGKTVRTIQGYLRSLEAKGLLHIETRLSPNGQHQTNSYDLRPFFRAIEGLARLDGLRDDAPACEGATPAVPGSSPRDDAGHSRGRHARPMGDNPACKNGPCDQNTGADSDAERGPLCAGTSSFGTDNRSTGGGTPTTEGGEGSCAGGVKNPSPQVNPIEVDSFDFDSIPPTPATTPKTTARRNAGTQTTRHDNARLQVSADPGDQALAAEIAGLSAELGDDAPRSSLGRARNLHRDAGVSLDRFLALLDEAAARTRDRQESIVKRRRDDQAPNGMPYLFAVLTDLLHPAPPRTADIGPNAEHRRAGPPGRRRRQREGGRGEPTNPYAAWSDSPDRLPIVEEHPVWRAALAELSQVMTVENYNAWLATTRAVGQEGDLLRVAVPAPFNKAWLEQKLAGKVTSALRKVNDDAPCAERVERIEYVIEVAA